MRTGFGTRLGNVPDAVFKVVGRIGRLNASRGAVDGTVEQVVSVLRGTGTTGAIPPLQSRGPVLRVRCGMHRRQVETPPVPCSSGLYLPWVWRATLNPAPEMLCGEPGARREQVDARSLAAKVPFPGGPTVA